MYNAKHGIDFYASRKTTKTGLLGVLQFLDDYDESWDDFQKIDTWEEAFPKELTRAARVAFLECDPTQYDCARWRAGMFDSVTTHFVIGKIVVPNTFVEGPPSEVSFAYTLRQQTEAKYYHKRTQVLDWTNSDGFNPLKQAVAWREKLDGSPCVTVNGELSCCHLTSPVRHDYAAELTSFGLYQLWPYGKLLDMDFDHELHHWQSFNQPYRSVKEGIIMLGNDGQEFRAKWNPTIELLDHHPQYPGVWEYELLPNGLRALRPRTRPPAKNTAQIAKAIYLEELVVDVCQALDICYHDDQSIIVLDKVYIPRFVQSTLPVRNEDVLTKPCAGGFVMYPSHANPIGDSIVGSKCMIFDPSGTFFLFKDGDKKWDLIGGTVEPYENTYQTLNREIKEECPDLSLANYQWQGFTSSGHHHSAIYLMRKVSVPRGFAPFTLSMLSVPWCNRLILHSLSHRNGYKTDTTFRSDSFFFSPWGLRVVNHVVQGGMMSPKYSGKNSYKVDPKFKKFLPQIKKILVALTKKGFIELSAIPDLYADIYGDIPDVSTSCLFMEAMSYLVPLAQPASRSWWDVYGAF